MPVSVASLDPPDHEGWLTKQGGSIKTWKRRWFVLKGHTLYYFKAQRDIEATGTIDLEASSFVKEDTTNKKRKFLFSVVTEKRVFLMYADTASEAASWVERIHKSLEILNNKQGQPAGGMGGGGSGGGAAMEMTPKALSPRGKLTSAKNVINFLQEEDSKVLEFWQIWFESIPALEDLQAGMSIDFRVATSADMQKLTWRTNGPQNIFIQKMVDFYWNVGAPESEIDRLNDVGALINPVRIGSWIDMSRLGGMDGGWFFPVEIPTKLCLEAADSGEPTQKVAEWCEKHNIQQCFSVGRDMGAAPPRQTELRIVLPAETFADELALALDAFPSFGFPPLSDDVLAVLKSSTIPGLCLSIITSSDGFVRLGLLQPSPSADMVGALCRLGGGSTEQIFGFQKSLSSQGPEYVEYQYLMKSFGYGVYKEGFDIVFHYKVGEDRVG